VSGLDHRLEPEGELRRFEIINGAMGRRRWSADDRARILEETLTPGAPARPDAAAVVHLAARGAQAIGG
jgi:hypothetical protein